MNRSIRAANTPPAELGRVTEGALRRGVAKEGGKGEAPLQRVRNPRVCAEYTNTGVYDNERGECTAGLTAACVTAAMCRGPSCRYHRVSICEYRYCWSFRYGTKIDYS